MTCEKSELVSLLSFGNMYYNKRKFLKWKPNAFPKTITVLFGKSSRNHCPFCLSSLHVDVNPGDRANECRGLLKAVAAITDPKKGYIIIHKCEKCGKLLRNRAAHDADVQPDDVKLIIKLTAHSGEYII